MTTAALTADGADLEGKQTICRLFTVSYTDTR
jgi:hypothetical protein